MWKRSLYFTARWRHSTISHLSIEWCSTSKCTEYKLNAILFNLTCQLSILHNSYWPLKPCLKLASVFGRKLYNITRGHKKLYQIEVSHLSFCGYSLLYLDRPAERAWRPFLAAILEITITHYFVHPENDSNEFLDPKNLGKETKFVTPGQILMELYWV